MYSTINSYRCVCNTDGNTIFIINAAVSNLVCDVAYDLIESFLKSCSILRIEEVISYVLGITAGISICAGPGICIVGQSSEIISICSATIIIILRSICTVRENVVQCKAISYDLACVIIGFIPSGVRVFCILTSGCICCSPRCRDTISKEDNRCSFPGLISFIPVSFCICKFQRTFPVGAATCPQVSDFVS